MVWPDKAPPACTIRIPNLNEKISDQLITTVNPVLRNPEIARVIVSDGSHALLPVAGRGIRTGRNCNIDDRFRVNARHGGATNVLNIDRV